MFVAKDLTKSYAVKGGRHYVFRDVNFSIPEGVNVGILGPNGAGKSTLLRIMGGIDYPDSGEIDTNSTFSWPLGLKGGFVGHLTGRENCRMVCRLYGFNREQMADILEQVKSKAGIGEYFEEPVKTYSSGMGGRLGFALSLSFDFDYYLVDEITSVGDARFKKMAKLALEEKTATSRVMLVSHSMATIRDFCDIGIYLEGGNVEVFEDLEEAIATYQGKTDKLMVSLQPDKDLEAEWNDLPEYLQKAFAGVVSRIDSIEQKLQNEKVEITGLEEGFFTQLANALENLGDRTKAMQYHQKALEIEPRHVASLQKLMLLAEQAKQWTDAEKWAEALEQIQPHSPHLAMYRARKLIADGAPDRALTQLNETLAKHPDLPGPLLEKSRVLESMGELGPALEAQELAVEKFPKQPGLKKRLGQLLATTGDLQRAMLTAWLAEPTPANKEKFQKLAEQLSELDERLSL